MGLLKQRYSRERACSVECCFKHAHAMNDMTAAEPNAGTSRGRVQRPPFGLLSGHMPPETRSSAGHMQFACEFACERQQENILGLSLSLSSACCGYRFWVLDSIL